jgi:hypothetical protein
MKEYKLQLPEDNFTLVEGESDNQLVTILVNEGLISLEHKIVFPWHLSILFLFPESESGRPTSEEKNLLDKYEDSLIEGLKESNDKPNALFLAARTGNSMKCLKFQVHNPEVANDYLQSVCERNDTPFPLDYKMEHDPEWIEGNGFFELTK